MRHEDHSDADRGRQLLIAILFFFCAASAIFGLNQIITGSKPPLVPVGRFALSVLLSYFVFKGSLIARVLFSVLSGIAAVMWAWIAITLALPKGIDGAALLLLQAAFNAFAAWAIFGVPHIRAYWTTLKLEGDQSAGQ